MKNEEDNLNDKFVGKTTVRILLKAIKMMLADLKSIKDEALSLLRKFEEAHPNKTKEEVKKLAAGKVISNYSYYAAFSSGATALPSVVPGVGTAVAASGGVLADCVLSMKYQIEMVMAIASIYGHDILEEETERLCFLVAGLGAINEAARKRGKAIATKAFIKMTRQYLKGASLVAVKEVFKKVGITFSRKALEKAAPFGVGVVISFSANKALSWYVGTKARDFFSTRA